ncbi:acyltransferase family protein [Bosea sp. 117]|uniref:acyltransferase family protein n=1 Tax=Bosea sp. 117 TaxID=1125973 RepID=UPI000494B499|nr:acyltransferase family protein [Bosea sp. 117]
MLSDKSGAPAERGSIVLAYQALRALAVSLVFANHLVPEALPGGFIGVDIFFVISGFLITMHLVREMEGGSFSFAGFYARRARRLLPAALTVLLATAIAVWLWLPPARIASAMNDVAAAALYVVNWRLANNSVDYFAEGAAASPVTHFWSLSVEEQFYLVWPALLLLSLHPRSPLRRMRSEHRLPVVLALVIVLSLAAVVLAPQVSRAAIYFETQSRAWEFAAGGLAALIARSHGGSVAALRHLALPSWAMLAVCGWLLGPQSGVPGFAAIPPVAATAVLLMIGDRPGIGTPAAVIRLRIVQWLGDRSYAIYLWHWPLVVIMPFALGISGHGATHIALTIALCLALSALTKPFIEDRFRFGRTGLLSRPVPALGALVLLSATVALGSYFAAGRMIERAREVAERLYALSQYPQGSCFGARAAGAEADCQHSHRLLERDFALQTWDTQIVRPPNGSLCQNPPGDERLNPCGFGRPESENPLRIALIGDSHAGMWGAALIEMARDIPLHVKGYLASSCAATLDDASFATYLTPERRPGCVKWRKAAINAVANDPSIDVVVVSGNAYNQARSFANGTWAEDDGQGFADAWRQFLAAGKRVVVMDDVPELPERLPDCLARTAASDDPCSYPAQRIPHETVFARAAAKIADDRFHFVRMRDVFCDEQKCHAVIGGIPAYMDGDHISAPLVRSLTDRLKKAVLSDGAIVAP